MITCDSWLDVHTVANGYSRVYTDLIEANSCSNTQAIEQQPDTRRVLTSAIHRPSINTRK